MEILEALNEKLYYPLVYDKGSYYNSQYFVMSLFGSSLQQILCDLGRSISINTVAYIAIKTLTILEHFHMNGYVHRDLKPGNFVVDYKNNVYLIDFGLAKKWMGTL